MIERTEACVDCKYWDCYESDLNNINELTDGSCHRYPPNAPSVSGVSDIGILMYESPFRGVQLLEHPITFAFDWCGEFCQNK